MVAPKAALRADRSVVQTAAHWVARMVAWMVAWRVAHSAVVRVVQKVGL